MPAPVEPPVEPPVDDSGVSAAADRWLPVVAVLETVSVLVLLLNRATIHLDPVTSILGPIHGTLYLGTIACGFLSSIPRLAKFLTIIPIVGGLLALLSSRRRGGRVPVTHCRVGTDPGPPDRS